jgi:hypothetical protein
MAEQGLKVAAAMRNTKDKHVAVFDAVHDNVFSDCHAAAAGAEVFIARASDVREAGQHKKAVGDGVDQAIGNLDAAAFLGDVIPDIVKVTLGVWRETMRHLTGSGEFGKEPRTTAFLHFAGKLVHGLLRDNTAFTTRKGSAGIVERQKKFGALPLAFLPQGKRLLHGVLFRVQPSAFNGAAGKSLLVRGKVYIHRLQITENRAARQDGIRQ